MSSYLSNLLTTTTSRYNSLRRTLLSDEADGDTEDDSHISRVLRAYYTEKGRPFPPWLPPDPKSPQPASTPQFVTSSGRQPAPTPSGRGGGLSDLWNDSPQQNKPQEPVSLRRPAQGRGGMQKAGMGDHYHAPSQQAQARPLPSQRAGSYQSQFSQASQQSAAASAASAGGTAQERLKARLWGSRSNSPAQNSGSNSPTSTPPNSQVGSRNPYDRQPSYSSTRSGPPYPDDRGAAGGRDSKPFTSANAPWEGGDNGFGGGYDNGSRGYGGSRWGLPSGPRPSR